MPGHPIPLQWTSFPNVCRWLESAIGVDGMRLMTGKTLGHYRVVEPRRVRKASRIARLNPADNIGSPKRGTSPLAGHLGICLAGSKAGEIGFAVSEILASNPADQVPPMGISSAGPQMGMDAALRGPCLLGFSLHPGAFTGFSVGR